MITYTWSISRLDCAPSENGLTNVVKVIHWGYTGQDENGTSASFNSSYPLPSPSPKEFTDYSTLTKETVVGWLRNSLDVGHLHTRLANEITSQYNPPITPLPLPWAVVEEPIVTEEPALTEQTLEEMVADGYNPNARDGDGGDTGNDSSNGSCPGYSGVGGAAGGASDGDGIVWEGTEWERPLDT